MVATEVNIPAVAAWGLTVLAITALVAAAVAVWRQNALKASMELIIEANAELRRTNSDLKDELAAERSERLRLEGRIDVLTSGLADQIVAAVLTAVARTRDESST